jgi:excinuclease ABC subunit A
VSDRVISLRGVEVHNLKHIDLDLPHGRLIVVCGVSGSGKTSLALDTLYAEGQRRYIETFSAYSRQFLDRLERPAAEKISGIPPAVAVTHKHASRSNRASVGTTTEIYDYLRLLYAKIGRVFCENCSLEVCRDSPQSAAELLSGLPQGARLLIAAPPTSLKSTAPLLLAGELREQGFVRAIAGARTIELGDQPLARELAEPDVLVVIDRLAAGVPQNRIRDSLETAFRLGESRCIVFVQPTSQIPPNIVASGKPTDLDGSSWIQIQFSDRLQCKVCGRDYLDPTPKLFSFNSPLGACSQCEGFGNVFDIDLDLIVPNPDKSLHDGAIAPWTTPRFEHEYRELAALAPDFGLPLDVPFKQLTDDQRRLLIEGVPQRNFGGLRGFFRWLDRHKYKMHYRVFASRWKSQRTCSACGGARLRPEALAVHIGGKSIADLCRLQIRDTARFMAELGRADTAHHAMRIVLDQISARLGYLVSVGLAYLTLDRTLRTLSGGEQQRVTLTSALGSSLVNMLYVLDEPSIGLHPADVDRLVRAVQSLRHRGNSVVVVEHEETMIRSADQVLEIGPGAGERGGQVVYQGSSNDISSHVTSVTGDYLAGRRGVHVASQRRTPDHGWIRLSGARGNNLRDLSIDFPLGVLCVVTGVSGAGKSTLVNDTLYPALRRSMRLEAPRPQPFRDILGHGQIDDVLLVDQSPIGRSPRSNPVTYIKAFDEIRAVFADTIEARTRNYSAGHFSFNMDGGRCPRCEGDGSLAIDMQFLADVYMTCPECRGKRYRKEILKVTYRGRSISDVLSMSIREAFTFFRGSPKVQTRLKQLIDVGLDYLRLGQGANTLSGGEAQRLKLASYLSSARRSRTLFILDEPTTGLHFADVTVLLDCFDALLAVGHSLIVVEHNVQLMQAADYIIDLGPGAADEGGRLVVAGTPEEVARQPDSATGRVLSRVLARNRQHA